MTIRHEKERVYIESEDGTLLAEATFPIRDGTAVLERTFVDASLRGQGIAGKLIEEAVSVIRASGLRARPVCSYAVRWFSEHPDEVKDLLETK